MMERDKSLSIWMGLLIVCYKNSIKFLYAIPFTKINLIGRRAEDDIDNQHDHELAILANHAGSNRETWRRELL